MNILLIAPLPPPVTGHSLASQVLVEALQGTHQTAVVNLSVGSLNDGRVSARRVWEVGKVLLAVWRRRWWADVAYLTISESRAGNLKDLVIYLIYAGRLRRLFVHLHGGTIGRTLFDEHPIWRWLNAAFIKRLGGVIISGPAHLGIFDGMIDRRRIHLVPNGAADELFVSEEVVERKFAEPTPLRILYLSSMVPDKGYLDLTDAWCSLGPSLQCRICVDFAGRFDDDAERQAFETRIAGHAGLRYHGLVDDATKRRLFAQAHVFCLPTRMFEGQPISILEAYASGCAVVTTGQLGVRDVFTDGVNGFEAVAGVPASLAMALTRAQEESGRLSRMAIANRRLADTRYRTSVFTTRLRGILESGGAP